jgi:hypothetical protein
MTKERVVSLKAQALERIVHAAREVYAASTTVQANFGEGGIPEPSTLELVKFAAAMQELKEAREAFDAMVSARQRNTSGAGGEGFTAKSATVNAGH